MTRLAAISLLLALGLAGALVSVARAGGPSPQPVPMVAQPVGGGIFEVPQGMVVVFLHPAGDGFSDGGDVPVFAQPAGDGFSDGGDVPEGMVAVFARLPGEGFSDGGDAPEGMIEVLMQPLPPPDR